MTAIDAAYDNIRLLRRKIQIAQAATEELDVGAQRDATLFRLSRLTEDLIRAMHDFADLGYEEEVADHLATFNVKIVRSLC